MLTKNDIEKLNYVDFMAILKETNRPPGGKEAIRKIALNTFLNKNSKILHIGCNTGSSTREFVHLTKCKAIGIDLSEEMIKSANYFKKIDSYKKNLKFKVLNAEKLDFKDEKFDLVFSAGSTAFMNNRDTVINEIIRVTKKWGFIGDTVLYYRQKPDQNVIKEINKLLGLEIKDWGLDYWIDIYKKFGLEVFFVESGEMYFATEKEVLEYCEYMVNKKEVQELIGKNKETTKYMKERLFKYMDLFNKNHEFLNYGILIFRKREYEEEKSLFGV